MATIQGTLVKSWYNVLIKAPLSHILPAHYSPRFQRSIWVASILLGIGGTIPTNEGFTLNHDNNSFAMSHSGFLRAPI